MELYKLGPILNLIGLVWYLVATWKNDNKVLFTLAVAYLALSVAVVTGAVTMGGGLAILVVLLFLGLCIGSLLNIWTLWMPLALIVGGSLMYSRLRPGADQPAVEQPLFDEGSSAPQFESR